MPLETNPKSLQKDLVIQELPDEVLIYNLRTNKAFCLNHTAAFVWQRADGETTVKQIAYLLQRKLKTPVDESVVWFALEQLAKDGLLENKTPAPLMFAGMNRRELIKTLGKSAAVALPLVMAITAPMAAHAQSNCLGQGQGPCGGKGARPCCSPLVCGSNTCEIDGGCVLWETEITTADGLSIRARDVAVGQSLLGVNCMNGETVAGRVKHVMEKETSGVYSIFAENGAVVNCSPSHLLIKGFGDTKGKRAEVFKEGDPLLVFDRASGKIVEAKTVAINRVEIYQPVLMFEMDTAEHTFVSGEIVSHNKGGGCVLWDTEITTADGLSVRARDVVVGQSLLGVNCMNGETIAGRVKHVMERETSGVYSIVAENGAVVNCSPSHDLIEGFGDTHGKRAEQFKEGDRLLVFDRASQKIVEAKTVAINYVEIYQPVLMFEMDTAEHTFVSGGIISHNVDKQKPHNGKVKPRSR